VARASDRPTKLTLPATPSLRPQASGRGRGRVHSELICLLSLMRYKSRLSSLSVCHGRATSWETEASQAAEWVDSEVTTAASDFSQSVLLSTTRTSAKTPSEQARLRSKLPGYNNLRHSSPWPRFHCINLAFANYQLVITVKVSSSLQAEPRPFLRPTVH